MKKLVFFDIDGTLLHEGETMLRDDVLLEVQSIMNDETEVFVCTGRCYHQAKKIIEKIGCKNYICSNGQEVFYDEKLVYNKVFSQAEMKLIEKVLEKENVGWGYETRENIFLPPKDFSNRVKKILDSYSFEDIQISKDIEISKKNMEIGIFQYWIFEENEQKINNILNNLGNDYKIYGWFNDCHEILPANESKAKGIKIIDDIFQKMGIETTTYAFGDGVNDIDMFKYVDVAVVMGNAKDEIKAYGHYVTTSCNDDGIKNGLVLAGLK